MPMIIDGNGSISGLSAGGLPAGSVIPATTQVGALPSMVFVLGANGFGSTNTAIRRYTNSTNGVNGAIIQGTDITYADSATLGATFTINANGVYAMSGGFGDNSIASTFGISKNSTQLSTGLANITAADRIAAVYLPVAGAPANAATTAYLPAGTVIRSHGTAQTANSTPGYESFTITRVA